MRKISIWAKWHKWPARLLLVLSILLLNITGIVTGLMLNKLGLLLPASIFFLFLLLYFAAFILYPSRSQRKKLQPAVFYRRQKTCDMLLAAAAFCMFICISNDADPVKTWFSNFPAAAASTPLAVTDSSLKTVKPIAAFVNSLKDENGKLLKWKERKKLLKEQVRAIKNSGEMSKGEKTLLIILCVVVALGLLFLVAGLACNLSCSGSDGAALLVGLGGSALIIFLAIIAIKAITGKRKKKTKDGMAKN
jgi:hypothetical protein